jgi:hypothetical protein
MVVSESVQFGSYGRRFTQHGGIASINLQHQFKGFGALN